MVKAALTHYGRIDILINNAAQGYDAPVEKTNLCTLQYLFDLDVVGPIVALKEVAPVIHMQGGGAVVNISSGLVHMHLQDMGAYSALKAALTQLSLTAAEELKDDNIAVSVVYPYITKTNFEKNTIKDANTAHSEQGVEGRRLGQKQTPPSGLLG